jgi:hypothetical protein
VPDLSVKDAEIVAELLPSAGMIFGFTASAIAAVSTDSLLPPPEEPQETRRAKIDIIAIIMTPCRRYFLFIAIPLEISVVRSPWSVDRWP